MNGQQFGFFIPNVAKDVWAKFQDIRSELGLTQRQAFVLMVFATCALGKHDPAAMQDLAKQIKAKLPHGASHETPQR